MQLNNIVKFIVAIVVTQLAGVIGSIFTAGSIANWYAAIEKPALNPPNWIFGPVWITLYFLIGISLYLVWKNDWKVVNPILPSHNKAWNRWSERLWIGDWQKANTISIFSVHYVLNVLWSYLFFGLQNPGLAFIWIIALWISIIYVMVNFYRVSKLATYLLVPYILWVSFAAYLNYSIWMLN